MIIREISAESTLHIRQQLLRSKLKKEDCYFPGDMDASTKHFGAFADGTQNDNQIGIVSIYQRDSDVFGQSGGYQIRAMATLEEARGKGAGMALLQAAEDHAFSNGALYVWANARVGAKGFYEKAGYDLGEKEFYIEGVGWHILICKYASLID